MNLPDDPFGFGEEHHIHELHKAEHTLIGQLRPLFNAIYRSPLTEKEAKLAERLANE